MKIGIVCPYNYFIHGGVQEHAKAQMLELIKRGHDVKLITPRPRNHKDEAPERVIFVGQSARFRTPTNTSSDISISVDIDVLERVLEEQKFDIIHFHEPAMPFLARQILSKVTIPTVGTFHAASPNNRVGKSFISSMTPYIRSFARQVSAITVVSPAAAELIGEDYTYETIPNGVDLKKYRPQKIKRDPNLIVFVGRLEKRKGPKYLIKAFAHLKQKYPKLRLEFAGDGPLRSGLEAYCRDQAIEDVTFRGFVEEDKKRELMARCGVFTSPALYGESFGIVLVEAMAMGAPVVAGNNPGYATVMTDRGALSLVDATLTEQYAARLELFLKDQELTQLWGRWALKAVKNFDWPKIVDKYEALYKKLVA
jgi:phosphatidylinositol alpha-mannosyltransferase